MASNCTIGAICASVKSNPDSKIQLIIVVIAALNTLLTMAAPFLPKTRAVQEIVFPTRVQHKREVKQKLENAIDVMQEAVRTISQRSDSERSNGVVVQQLPAADKKKPIDVLG